MMSDQVIYSFLMFLYMNQWTSGMITVYDSADLGSDPDGVKILIFQISIPWRFWQLLGRSGVYRHTFGMKIHRPHGLVGECWAINREVSGSIPSPKSAV